MSWGFLRLRVDVLTILGLQCPHTNQQERHHVQATHQDPGTPCPTPWGVHRPGRGDRCHDLALLSVAPSSWVLPTTVLLTQTFSKALGGSYFKKMLTPFSTPEEVVGPYDLGALDQNRYERAVDGYLPTADVAFLDEIFKANSAILNSFLTLLNEREFEQGHQVISCPLQVCVGASNEYPADESLNALYDRFLLRRWVEGVSIADRRRCSPPRTPPPR